MAEQTPERIIRELSLSPLPGEGGFFVRSYTSGREFPEGMLDEHGGARRPFSTAIYYLVTPASFSRLHRLNQDEIWHFYLGDPVSMLILNPDGTGEERVLGTDLASGQRPQMIMPRGAWFGGNLVPGGRFALLGATLCPGFADEDYRPGDREDILARYPAFGAAILRLLPD